MATTAWEAGFCTNSICLSENGRTSCDNHHTNEFIIFQHRNVEEGACAGQLDDCSGGGSLHLHVRNVNDLFSRPDTIKVRSRSRTDDGIASPFLQERLRRAIKCDVPSTHRPQPRASFRISFANRMRFHQHGVEHRLQLPSRAGDNLENFRGRRLLRQRFLADIVRALAQFGEQARVFDGDDGLLGEIAEQLAICSSAEWSDVLSENL